MGTVAYAWFVYINRFATFDLINESWHVDRWYTDMTIARPENERILPR